MSSTDIRPNTSTQETGSLNLTHENGSYQEYLSKKNNVVRIHRVNLLDEMIVIFKDADIVDRKVTFEFVNECGSDLNGVSRDSYSSFWVEFFRRSSEGEESRVPALNPKWQGEEWQAIGRIISKGYIDQNIFPIQMSLITTIVLSFGEDSVVPKMLHDAFLKYISKTERDIVMKALDGNMSEDDSDDLLELLDRFGCTTSPNKENLRAIICHLAHKELIQKPKYATDNMALGCREKLLSLFSSVDEILKIYKDMEPTARKVVKLLDATPKTNGESSSLRFFQQYIRGQNSSSLKKLLRFLTGSETITVSKIEVMFTHLDGLGRRPIAHTCGPLLELPSTYTCYPELRNEFDSILADESCFIMNDIIVSPAYEVSGIIQIG